MSYPYNNEYSTPTSASPLGGFPQWEPIEHQQHEQIEGSEPTTPMYPTTPTTVQLEEEILQASHMMVPVPDSSQNLSQRSPVDNTPIRLQHVPQTSSSSGGKITTTRAPLRRSSRMHPYANIERPLSRGGAATPGPSTRQLASDFNPGQTEIVRFTAPTTPTTMLTVTTTGLSVGNTPSYASASPMSMTSSRATTPRTTSQSGTSPQTTFLPGEPVESTLVQPRRRISSGGHQLQLQAQGPRRPLPVVARSVPKYTLRSDTSYDPQTHVYTIVMELPGLKKTDVDIELSTLVFNHTRQVIVKGRSEPVFSDSDVEADLDRGKNRLRIRERRYGDFERKWDVPINTRPEDIDATMQDGVLWLKIQFGEPLSNEEEDRQVVVIQ